MAAIEQAVQWAVSIANDNSHGYSQANRWGPDYDCSSLVIQAWQNAGVPVKSKGATYTGNMRSIFIACGFVDVTNRCSLTTGYGMERGDVLLNYSAHTAMFIGNGKVVHARSSEGNTIAGDQSGNEIRVQNYWNFPWNCVLRYKEGAQVSSGMTVVVADNSLGKGSKGDKVKELQKKLIELGYSVGPDGADGDYGNNTMAAVKQFQTDNGLTATGTADEKTQKAINSAKKKEEPAVIATPNTDEENHSWNPSYLGPSNAYSQDAVVLQAVLNRRHFPCGSADGFYAAKTQAAVGKAQQYYGLPVTGVCNKELWLKLLEIPK